MLESLLQDIRYSLRTFRFNPATTITIVVTLALGIGANITLYSVVDTVLLRPLPFSDPDRLVMIWNRYESNATASSPPDYIDRRDRAHSLDSIAAVTRGSRNLSGDLDLQQVAVGEVTSDFFNLLGVSPLAGHVAFPREDGAEVTRAAVLSYGLWQRSFGGRREVIGQTVELDGESYTVQAVMPPDFDFPRGCDLWLPLTFTPELSCRPSQSSDGSPLRVMSEISETEDSPCLSAAAHVRLGLD